MKDTFLIILMILFVSCSSEVKKTQNSDAIVKDTITSNENNNIENISDYLKVRNDYIEKFKKIDFGKVSDSLGNAEKKALIHLENGLCKILKNSIFSGKGKINLETLFQCLGFGMLDGLTLERDSMRIFYTSKGLFLDYFKTEKISEFDGLTPENLESIFSSAFVSDAGLIHFAYTKIQSTKYLHVYGMISLVTQMEGPFLPNNLYVLVESDDFIYMAEKQIKKPIKEIVKCKSVYDSIHLESEKNFEIYRASKLKDTMAIKLVHELDSKAWRKYCECYQKELINDSQFTEIQKQLEKIVIFLEREKD